MRRKVPAKAGERCAILRPDRTTDSVGGLLPVRVAGRISVDERLPAADIRPLPVILQQPPPIRIALMLTSASATFVWAAASILVNVGRDTLILRAASICLSPERSASLSASNSSSVMFTPCSSLRGLQQGRKHRSSGSHLIHLVFFGRIQVPSYERMFKTGYHGPECRSMFSCAGPRRHLTGDCRSG